jgi:hypothetical protein
MNVITWDCKIPVSGGNMHKTYREINGKTYMLDELSYFGLSKSGADKRKAMLKKSGLGVRCIKKANGKFVVYWEYPGDIHAENGSSLCHWVESQVKLDHFMSYHRSLYSSQNQLFEPVNLCTHLILETF